MDYLVGVAELQSISNGKNYLCDLGLIGATMQIIGGVELAALAVLHDDEEVARVVVDLIYFYDVGVFQLNRDSGTESKISHSFMYILRS